MQTKILQLISLLTKNEKIHLFQLVVTIVTSGLLQLVAIVSFMPFIAMLASPDLFKKNILLSNLIQYLNLSSQSQILMASGIFILTTLVLSNAIQALSVWQINKFGYNYGRTLSINLLHEYISRPYLFFVHSNSAASIKNINDEVWRVANGILIPLLHTTAGMIKILFIVLLLLFVNVWATLGMATLIGGSYILIAYIVKGRLTRNGQETSILFTQRTKTIRELFDGIKEIKLLGRENIFLGQYERTNEELVNHQIYGVSVQQLPRYFLEIITFGTLLSISIFLSSDANASLILPLIALFVMAGYRLMPAMQEVYGNFTIIKNALPAFDAIYNDLLIIQSQKRTTIDSVIQKRLPIYRNITLNKLSFTYPGANKPALNGLTIDIAANSSIGLVGASGSGKSTLVDILLGLLHPQSGALQVDGVNLTPNNMREWQNNIGYVPQHIYLIDDTISRNIALGIPIDEIDIQAVERAARAANLHEFIFHELPLGYHTEVGERGVRLSGGQRQRIGIARALYHSPAVLVLDEATSALDSVTETAVIEAIEKLSGSVTTIMIAHRISTLKECDIIHRIAAGEVVESGSYETLMANSEEFRKLANFSDDYVTGNIEIVEQTKSHIHL